MPRSPFTKIIAVLAVVAGALWCGEVSRSFIPSLFRIRFANGNEFWNGLVIFWAVFLPILFLLPGIFAVYRGFRLFRRKELKNYKGVTGSLAVMCGIPICVYGERIIRGEDSSGTFLLLTVTVVSISLYLPLTRWLMRRDGFATPKTGDLLGRGVMCLIAFGLWVAANGGLRIFHPDPFKHHNGLDLILLDFASTLTPVILAVIFYRQACKWLEAPERRVYRRVFPAST